METNELKKLIGRECVVIDSRSKKKVFETATINSVTWSTRKSYNGELYDHISYGVTLHKLTIRKNKFFPEYHRSFDVSGDSIRIE